MTIGSLCQILQQLGEQHGSDTQVFIIDDEGEWPFAVSVQREVLGAQRVVVYLDVTGEADALYPLGYYEASDDTDNHSSAEAILDISVHLKGIPAHSCPASVNPAIWPAVLLEWRTAWSVCARAGHCDALDGMEYQRVFRTWCEQACPENMLPFIIAEASRLPSPGD